MFQNISFPFLSALALISWTVLCYLHFVEEHLKSEDYNIEIYTERSRFTDRPQFCPVKSGPSHTSRAYDLLVSYGVILTATVALSKLLKFLELETANWLRKESANLPVDPSFPNIAKQLEQETEKEEGMSSQFLHHNLDLREQLDDLQARCQELLQELRNNGKINEMETKNYGDLDDCEPSKSSSHDSETSFMSTDNEEDNSGVIMWKQPADLKSSRISVLQADPDVGTPLTHNVFVTHSHIHINFNGPIRLSQQNLNIDTLRLRDGARNSEFRQVWGKCLKGPNAIPMLTGIHSILM
ncbi:hypothetical protein KR044_006104 [Drosophila immigrans]|nr:hypothetical protein KR044_006104 [Drosophila immigrans]